ncbi:methyltransferase domain-containing protein [Mariniflexile sp.]|uniref:methyltransferase domain-containing protein n=1 Tax=Mariniflexile sp. TaxID=1979402 RepID=UPI0035696714
MKYIHTESVHNLKAANQVVPALLKMHEIRSVVDVGCGIGTWLKVFETNGVSNILGIDGDYIDSNKLVINKSNFLAKDLEQPFTLNRKFSLVLSLEVAEHLKPNCANNFIDSLCELGDFIVFSAAIPSQGGQNHINEQEPAYWIEKFKSRGYIDYDILRPLFWENIQVDWWYKQNMIIFCKNESLKIKLESYKSFKGQYLIHPILFQNRSREAHNLENELKRIRNAEKLVSFYFTLLRKAFIKKIKN